MNGPKLIVIGGGKMARAIVEGAIASDVEAPGRFVICEPDADRRDRFSHEPFSKRVIATAERIEEAMSHAEDGDQILLAVKPQSLAAVAEDLRRVIGPSRRLVISILAGTPSAKIRAAIGRQTAVIRVMPNLAASLRQGVTAIAVGEGAAEGNDALAMTLFAGCGMTLALDESLMDAFTALAGSGPAYVFYLAQAMIEAAVELGVEPSIADRVVRQTIVGAGALLSSSDETAEALRKAVTSKGGTTAAAIETLEAQGVMPSIRRAVAAACERGAELAKI